MLEIAEPGAAIFLLDGDAVQAERADLRPKVARKLIALVDFSGARRDLVVRKALHGFADRVGGLAEIEIEHPMRIGDHGRGGLRKIGLVAHSLRRCKQAWQTSLSRSAGPEKGPGLGAPGRANSGAEYPVFQGVLTSDDGSGRATTGLALAGATGCNSHQITLRNQSRRGQHHQETPDAWNNRSRRRGPSAGRSRAGPIHSA